MDTAYLRDLLTTALHEAESLTELVFDSDVDDSNHRSLEVKLRHVAATVDALMPGSGGKLETSFEIGFYSDLIRLIGQALYELDHADALREALGPEPGPTLRADALHPTVWGACASLWRSNHRREAVNAAAVAVNAALQNKVGRRDQSNAQLWQETLSVDPPAEGRPRLRVHEDDGSQTYESMQKGALAFGQGCFKAIRNTGPAHTLGDEPEEHLALEQLAAFSIMARWVEDGFVITAD